MYDEMMTEAIAEARKAEKRGEVPIGAVIEKDGEIIGRGHNLTETLKDPTAHAEMIAIQSAAKKLGGWRLSGCNLYVTCEPCAMCAGAMVNARVRRVIFGMSDPRSGAAGGALNITGFPGMLHQVEVKSGVLELECKALMQQFFQNLRTSK